jgi:hypothetical protein
MWAYNDLICPYLGVFNPIANISFIIDRVIRFDAVIAFLGLVHRHVKKKFILVLDRYSAIGKRFGFSKSNIRTG